MFSARDDERLLAAIPHSDVPFKRHAIPTKIKSSMLRSLSDWPHSRKDTFKRINWLTRPKQNQDEEDDEPPLAGASFSRRLFASASTTPTRRDVASDNTKSPIARRLFGKSGSPGKSLFQSGKDDYNPFLVPAPVKTPSPIRTRKVVLPVTPVTPRRSQRISRKALMLSKESANKVLF